MNFHLKDDLRMEFIVYSNEMMQEGVFYIICIMTHVVQTRLTNNRPN